MQVSFVPIFACAMHLGYPLQVVHRLPRTDKLIYILIVTTVFAVSNGISCIFYSIILRKRGRLRNAKGQCFDSLCTAMFSYKKTCFCCCATTF
jgi:hypothetical protein